MNDELMHFGTKGMRWGFRRLKKKKQQEKANIIMRDQK